MAEAGPEHLSLSLHSPPCLNQCFGNTVTSSSEDSAVMDMSIKTEPDDQDISHPEYCTEVLGSMLHLDSDQIKTEILMVRIKEDNVDLQPNGTAEEFCLPSKQSNSSTCLLSKKETDKVKVEQHSHLQEPSCTQTEINEAAHCGIKEEYVDSQVDKLSASPCYLSTLCKSKTDKDKVEQQSQLQGPSSTESSFLQACRLKEHHLVDSDEKPYKCSECGKSFSRVDNLKQHQRFHSGEKSYKCNQCGKCFSQAGTLKHHQLVHSGEKPHKCTQCGKNFSRSNHLKVHQRVHSGEKPYKCTECGKSFSRGSTLKQHQLVHSGEKPYTCSECGKSFSRGDNLKVHQLIHSGDKPYKCTECGKNFSHGGNLKKHQLTHSAEKPYKCSECGKNFALRKYLKIHERTHNVLMYISLV